MISVRAFSTITAVLVLCATEFLAAEARAAKLSPPPAAYAVVEEIYSGDAESAIDNARRMQQEQPEHPLGYLLEGEALWWRIWCTSSDFKWGMNDARHRPKLAADKHYFDLAAKVSRLAEVQLKRRETPEMQFYAGMGYAMAARIYGLRGENRNTARAGVRAREHFLRALSLDPELADADLGLGLYNYYVDTLSAMAKMLRFFMGIPGGDKREGLRQLDIASTKGELTQIEARFNMAKSLRNYDRDYARAEQAAAPLFTEHPGNCIFLLLGGDIEQKLGHTEEAAAKFRAASTALWGEAKCAERAHKLASEALAALSSNH